MVLVADFETINNGEGNQGGDHAGVFYAHDFFFDVVFWHIDIIQDLVNVKEAPVEQFVDLGEDSLSNGVFDF